MKKSILFVGILLLMSLMISCGGGAPANYFAEDAVIAGGIDVKGLMGNKHIKAILDKDFVKGNSEQFLKMFENAGLDLKKDLSKIYFSAQDTSGQNFWVILEGGNPDLEKVKTLLQMNPNADASSAEVKKIMEGKYDALISSDMAIVKFSKDKLIITSTALMAKAVSVVSGDAKSVQENADFYKQISNVSGNTLWVATDITKLGGLIEQSPFAMQAAQYTDSIEYAGVSINLGSKADISVSALCTDEKTAKGLSGMAQMAKGLASGEMGQEMDKDTKEVINSLSASNSGKQIKISASVPEALIQKSLDQMGPEMLQGMMGGGF